MTVNIPDELLRRVHAFAILDDVPLQVVVAAALEGHFAGRDLTAEVHKLQRDFMASAQ